MPGRITWPSRCPSTATWPTLSAGILDRNGFPREVLLETLIRFVEEDLLAAR